MSSTVVAPDHRRTGRGHRARTAPAGWPSISGRKNPRAARDLHQATKKRGEALDACLFGPPVWARPRCRTSRAELASTCGRRPVRCSSPRRSRRDSHHPSRVTCCSPTIHWFHRQESCIRRSRVPADIMIGEGGRAQRGSSPAVHAGGRNARRHADQPVTRPFRDRRPPRVLQRRRTDAHRARSASSSKISIEPDGA
jgi:hypothetical protein